METASTAGQDRRDRPFRGRIVDIDVRAAAVITRARICRDLLQFAGVAWKGRPAPPNDETSPPPRESVERIQTFDDSEAVLARTTTGERSHLTPIAQTSFRDEVIRTGSVGGVGERRGHHTQLVALAGEGLVIRGEIQRCPKLWPDWGSGNDMENLGIALEARPCPVTRLMMTSCSRYESSPCLPMQEAYACPAARRIFRAIPRLA